MLEVRNIAFAYRRESVLRDVSFVVSPGETVCVLGANGAGKTTLMRILATLAAPDAGCVLTDGRDILRHSEEYRRALGYMPERVALYDDMTVKEYLVYRARLKGEPRRRIRRRVGEAAELCRVADVLRRPIRTLAPGYVKRVALADALLLRPRVLLLDDFLAGMDFEMRESAGDVLARAAAFSCVIVTGHELDELVGLATRFLVLRDGIVAAAMSKIGIDERVLRDRLRAVLRGEAL